MPATSHLKIRGYKSIERVDLQFRSVKLLIGANGAGKSNFIGFFRMLNEIVEGRFQLYVQRSGRASALLYYGPKATESIDAGLYFGLNCYEFRLVPTEDDRLVFAKETTYFKGNYRPEPMRKALGSGTDESSLPKAYESDRRQSYPGVPGYVYPSVRSWRVYHFHDTSSTAPVKQEHGINDNEMLRSDAGNVAAFLYLLRERHSQNYELIRATVRRIFPRFEDFALRPNPLNPDRIRLEWRERGNDYLFGPNQLSDGTLRFICLATLLLQPHHATNRKSDRLRTTLLDIAPL